MLQSMGSQRVRHDLALNNNNSQDAARSYGCDHQLGLYLDKLVAVTILEPWICLLEDTVLFFRDLKLMSFALLSLINCVNSAGESSPKLGGEGPRRRKWQPTPVFLPGESRGQRSLVGCTPRGDRVRQTEHTRTSMRGVLGLLPAVVLSICSSH